MHLSAIEIPYVLLYNVYALYSNTVPVFDICYHVIHSMYLCMLHCQFEIIFIYFLFLCFICQEWLWNVCSTNVGNVLDDPHHVKRSTTETRLITCVDQRGTCKWALRLLTNLIKDIPKSIVASIVLWFNF